MRKIKFRAWDKKYGKFVNQCDFFNEDLSLTLDGHVLYSNNADMSSHFILNQFTGLTDKNGKEIYEGDIVKSYIEWQPEPNLRVVKFIDGEFKHALNRTPRGCEIIGNIHQNPELIQSLNSVEVE